jgi:hypothetical protein
MPLGQHALTTVAAVRQALVGRDTIPPDHDGLLEALINGVSEAIEQYCSRHFERRSYSERLPGSGSALLLLAHYPVVSVTQVWVWDQPVTDWQLEPSREWPGYYRGLLWRPAGWPAPVDGMPNVRVDYQAGWVLPKDPGRDLPADVEQAAIDLVVAAYRLRDKLGVRSETYEGLSIQLDWWPLHVRQILDRYRRIA